MENERGKDIIKKVTDPEIEELLRAVKEKAEKKAEPIEKEEETEQPVEEVKEKETEKSVEEVKEKETEKSVEEVKEKETEKSVEEVKEKETEKSVEEVKEKETEKSVEKVKEKEIEKPMKQEDNIEVNDEGLEAYLEGREEEVIDPEIEEPMVLDDSQTVKKGDKISFRSVFSNIMEGLWTCFKIAVILLIVTVVSGTLISKDMMIRGSNGSRKCLAEMKVSGASGVNKTKAQKKVEKWLDKVEREKLTLETDDKSILVARQIITDPNSDKWVVILHGYNGTMEDVYDIAMNYADNGYNILTPDLRGNGESEGAFLGMGWTDRLDIINWIDVILKKNPSAQVVIHGVDVGADAALMLSGEPLKSSIKAIVAEGAYPKAWDVVKKEYKARHEKLPAFPFLNMLNPVMKVLAGYDLKDANAVKQVKNTTVPILLINGANDTYVTPEMTEELNQAIASAHKVLTIQTGVHEDCRFAEPDNYYNGTFDFLDSYVK